MQRRFLLLVAVGVMSTAVVVAAAGRSRAGGVSSVSRAVAAQSAKTHRGADSLSGVRIAGRCAGARARVGVGHRAPFKPLRPTGSPQIDSQPVPRRASLEAPCRDGRFSIRRDVLVIRDGAGPPRVLWPGGQVPVKVSGRAIE